MDVKIHIYTHIYIYFFFFWLQNFYLWPKQFCKKLLLSIQKSHFFAPERINPRQGLEKTVSPAEKLILFLICQLKLPWEITHCHYLIKNAMCVLPLPLSERRTLK